MTQNSKTSTKKTIAQKITFMPLGCDTFVLATLGIVLGQTGFDVALVNHTDKSITAKVTKRGAKRGDVHAMVVMRLVNGILSALVRGGPTVPTSLSTASGFADCKQGDTSEVIKFWLRVAVLVGQA